jgi:hypothetical protein
METALASVGGIPAGSVRPGSGDGSHDRKLSPTARGTAPARRRTTRNGDGLSGLVFDRMTHTREAARNEQLVPQASAGPSEPLSQTSEALANHRRPPFGKGPDAKKIVEGVSETDRNPGPP